MRRQLPHISKESLSDLLRDNERGCSCGNEVESQNCPFAGQCQEALAWSLNDREILDQQDCPLFTTIPVEIRDMIWAYALTDCTSYPPDRERAQGRNNRDRHRDFHPSRVVTYKSDVALSLLQTCRAVYRETYVLPLSLNPYIVPSLHSQMKETKFLPWQFAYIQGLDITLPQLALERGELRDALAKWHPQARHMGVFVAPRFYKHEDSILTPNHDTHELATAFGFAFLSTTGYEKSLQQLKDASSNGSRILRPDSLASKTQMRITVARPLTHLTLRLSHTDWWTWSDNPESSTAMKQLSLDPTIGPRATGPAFVITKPLMHSLAEQRRAGRYPNLESSIPDTIRPLDGERRDPGWGPVVGSFPDLKSLELVLETFAPKKAQLDDVAECAKTWQFPISGTQHMLEWDGNVEAKQWSYTNTTGLRPRKDASWADRCDHFEVRIVRYVRRRVL